MRFIFASLESQEAVKTRIHPRGLGNLGFPSGAAANELPDLGHITVRFQVLDSKFLCHTDEHLNLKICDEH